MVMVRGNDENGINMVSLGINSQTREKWKDDDVQLMFTAKYQH